jgi:hypothetical protein
VVVERSLIDYSVEVDRNILSSLYFLEERPRKRRIGNEFFFF